MKGDLVKVKNRIGQILRIVLINSRKKTTVEFFDATRRVIDLNEYVWEKEKKLWEKT
jgi:hypothetical protein